MEIEETPIENSSEDKAPLKLLEENNNKIVEPVVTASETPSEDKVLVAETKDPAPAPAPAPVPTPA